MPTTKKASRTKVQFIHLLKQRRQMSLNPREATALAPQAET